MIYKLNKRWTTGAGWRNVEKKNKKGDWRTDYFSHLDIINNLSVSSVGIKNRVQFAYTCRYKGKDTPDVRYRVDLYPSRFFSAIKVSPYLAGELLYDFDASHIYWIRQFTGLRASPYKWFGFDLYLMRQEDKKPGKPQCEKYIYGLSARLKF